MEGAKLRRNAGVLQKNFNTRRNNLSTDMQYIEFYLIWGTSRWSEAIVRNRFPGYYFKWFCNDFTFRLSRRNSSFKNIIVLIWFF